MNHEQEEWIPFNQEEWNLKIKEASIKLDAQNLNKFHPAFNHSGSAEIMIPGDTGYYRVPMEMWYEYHEAKYDCKIDR